MKRLGLFVIAIALIAGLLLPSGAAIQASPGTQSITFTGLEMDATLANTEVGTVSAQQEWDDVRNDVTSSDNWIGPSGTVAVAGRHDSGTWTAVCYRPVLYFDTSSLPDDCTVTSATLRLRGTGAAVQTEMGEWHMVIQDGTPIYPQEPPVNTDYSYVHYSGDGGSISSDDMGTGYKDIALSSDGLTWISKTDVTKFILRELEHDINDTLIGYDEGSYNTSQWIFYLYEQGVGYEPELIVYYSASILPTIITKNATYIATTTARLNSYVIDDGGEACDVRFEYGNSTGNYTVDTEWVDDIYRTGSNPHADITDLVSNTTYYFRVLIKNTVGIAYGAERSFTAGISETPADLTAFPTSHSVSLTWTKGADTTNTMVRGQIGAFPVSVTDGEQIYFGPMSTASHTGLSPGYAYFYRAWGESGGNYTDNYVETVTTTYAGVGEGDVPGAAEIPSAWYGTPDHTRLSEVPFYGMINDMAGNYGMPPTNFWLLLMLFGASLMGLFVYRISHSGTVAIIGGGVTLTILLASLGGLLWIVFAVGIIATGVFVQVRRA